VLDTYNSRRPEAFDALLTEDCTLIRDGAEARGREAVKRVLGQLYRAIPDLEYRIDGAVSAGDKIAIRWEGHGTHRGEYQGVAPTGSEMSYGGITIYEMRGDLIARIWVSTNLLEQLRKVSELAKQTESQANALH
jgi:predicted ester cyclase